MILSDTHTHSTLSHDGVSTAYEMALAAKASGLQSLYLTEHFDAYLTDPANPRIRYFEDAIFAPREPLPEGIELPLSIELGEMNECPDYCRELLERHPYDFVLGSLHHLPGRKGFLSSSYTGRAECEYLLDAYFDQLICDAEENEYDSFAHIDYPLRYFYYNAGVLLHLEDRLSKLEELLSILVKRKKALELNTATLRKGYPTLMGDALALFRSLGGEYVTIGSDAHETKHLSCYFKEAEEVCVKAGFDHYTLYRARQPRNVLFTSDTID